MLASPGVVVVGSLKSMVDVDGDWARSRRVGGLKIFYRVILGFYRFLRYAML